MQGRIEAHSGWMLARGRTLRLVPLSAAIALTLGITAALAFATALGIATHAPLAMVTAGAVFLASLISSVGGLAFSPLAGAILFHICPDPIVVVQILLVCSLASQALGIWKLRTIIRWREAWHFAVGGLIGVPAGVLLLLRIDADLYLRVLGGLVAVYGATAMLRRPVPELRPMGRTCKLLVGFAGGITGGFAATPSAPVVIWCSGMGWEKARLRGVLQPFILLMQVVAIGCIAVLHRSGAVLGGFGPRVLLYVPPALIGTGCGIGWFRRLDERQFRCVVNLLLIASGIGLCV